MGVYHLFSPRLFYALLHIKAREARTEEDRWVEEAWQDILSRPQGLRDAFNSGTVNAFAGDGRTAWLREELLLG